MSSPRGGYDPYNSADSDPRVREYRSRRAEVFRFVVPFFARFLRPRVALLLCAVLVGSFAHRDALAGASTNVCPTASARGGGFEACSGAEVVTAFASLEADSLIPVCYGGADGFCAGGTAVWQFAGFVASGDAVFGYEEGAFIGTGDAVGFVPAVAGGSSGSGSVLPELSLSQAAELFGAALPLLALAWVGWFLRRTLWRVGR